MTITEFLLARIAEDEAWARNALMGWSDEPLGLTADPARVLAECEAKRQIVEEASGWIRPTEGMDGEDILQALASVYADHPDYRQEWAT